MRAVFQPTEEQLRVLEHPVAEHGRLLAGPGTGKSITAVQLAVKLLQAREPTPRLKFLTFTRAATAELAQKLAGSMTDALEPSTFHSFAISVVLENPGCAVFPHPLRIPDDYELKALIKPHLKTLLGITSKKLEQLLTEMYAHWESLSPAEDPDITAEERAAFLGTWDLHRAVFGYTLVGELPNLMHQAVSEHEDLSGLAYDLLVVDEYQDLNACELGILKRLSEAYGVHVLAVGDDDQSIYSWRKAHPEGIRKFLDEFDTDKDYQLTICHRSPKRIFDWSQFVIQGDSSRIHRPAPVFANESEDDEVALLRFGGNRQEAQGIAQLVRRSISVNKVQPSDILILYRTDHNGSFTRLIREELGRCNIEYQDPEAIKRILGDACNRITLAHLRLLIDRTDALAWWTLIRQFPGLGPAFENEIFELARSNGKRFGEIFVEEALLGFPDLRSKRSEALVLYEGAVRIINSIGSPDNKEDSGWGDWIISRAEGANLPPISEEMKDLLRKIDVAVSGNEYSFERYLSQINPIGKDLATSQASAVRLMSMAGSKGLTAEVTIIAGVDNDLIPREDADRSEERRLLYVAMTRSRRALFLTWTTRRRGPSARSGRANTGRRQYSAFLLGGPVASIDGATFINALLNP